jgi:hypothetical protein
MLVDGDKLLPMIQVSCVAGQACCKVRTIGTT